MLNVNIAADLMISHAKLLTNYLELTNGERITNLNLPEFELENQEAIFFVVRNTHATLNSVKKESNKFDPHFKGRITSRNLSRNIDHKQAVVILTNQRICIFNQHNEILRAFDINNIHTVNIKKTSLSIFSSNNKCIKLYTNDMNINYRFTILLNMMKKITSGEVVRS